jgi:hypothetical protein
MSTDVERLKVTRVRFLSPFVYLSTPYGPRDDIHSREFAENLEIFALLTLITVVEFPPGIDLRGTVC